MGMPYKRIQPGLIPWHLNKDSNENSALFFKDEGEDFIGRRTTYAEFLKEKVGSLMKGRVARGRTEGGR